MSERRVIVHCEMCGSYTPQPESYVRSFYSNWIAHLATYNAACKPCLPAYNKKYEEIAKKEELKKNAIAAFIKSRTDRGLPVHVKCECSDCAIWRSANFDKIKDLKWD